MKTVARVQVLLHRLGKLIKVERIRDLQNSHRSREEQILRVDLLFDVEAVPEFSVEVLRWWLPRCDFKRRFGETLRGGPVIRAVRLPRGGECVGIPMDHQSHVGLRSRGIPEYSSHLLDEGSLARQRAEEGHRLEIWGVDSLS